VAGGLGVPPAWSGFFPGPRGRQGSHHEAEIIMLDGKREQNRDILRNMIVDNHLTRQQTADLLYQSIHTLNAWLKPATSSSSNPAPKWAIELLAYKLADPAVKR